MQVLESSEFFVLARTLLASVFVGLALENIYRLFAVLRDADRRAPLGALALTVFELVCGVMILFGWQVRWIALVLGLFSLLDAFMFHPFWREESADRHGQLLHFLKNISILGGLMLLVWAESVRPSV